MINKINVAMPGENGAPARMQVIPADWLPDRLAAITLEGRILGWLELAGGFWKVSYRDESKGEAVKEVDLSSLPVRSFASNNAVAVWACSLVLNHHNGSKTV